MKISEVNEKSIIYTDEEMSEILEKIKKGKSPGEVLHNTFLYLFGVDISDPNMTENEIRPWEYRMSSKLADELLCFCKDELDSFETAFMLWLNYGPSARENIEYNQIKRVIGDDS